MKNNKYMISGQSICEIVATFVNTLKSKGFTIINDGNYDQEKDKMPDPDSLYFRLRSPVNLGEIDLTDETYYLVTFSGNLYMCECHYHLVKLISPDQD